MLVTIVKNAIRNNRLPQVYLLNGQFDCNVKHMLFETVKIINCESSNNTPCLKCKNCKSIENGNWPELLYIDENIDLIGIDMVREIRKFVKYSPSEPIYKTILIPFIERMNKESANSFLKTLEEPLENIIFILHTEEEQRILATIKSRCQKVFLGHQTIYDDIKTGIDNEIIEKINNLEKYPLIERMKLVEKLSDFSIKQIMTVFYNYIENKINNMTSNESISELVKKSKVLLDAKRFYTPKANRQLWVENLLVSWGNNYE